MKIRVGQIVYAKHFDDNEKKNFHPFLIMNITTNNIWALQCASVKKANNQSYFSSSNIYFYELKYSNIKYLTHVRLDSFEKIASIDIKSHACDSNWEDYKRIAQKMLSITWANNEYFNNNEIHKHVQKGMEQFDEEWSI